ncbi:hypothetical protein HXX76_009823 [Chlamydomonas incerta]|uniref:Uncharacterized protein n=1 Tax=Chlamydomonas incerta TaxID=51695 RepID=A0A835SZ21_CHLIN|nr:hypothetical protein HXX76_009823 [Chlamydomonas incerta]|eukprot:KAG2430849.1 hypothetical protein HXX76_009823 [Chlamydomonas incerta]
MGGEVWPPPPRPPVWTPPNSHATLLVTLPTSPGGGASEAAVAAPAGSQQAAGGGGGGGGERYVLDMGYPLRPLQPLRLAAGAEQWQADGRGYRLEWDEEGARGAWSVYMCLQGKWLRQHRFWPDAPRAAADFAGPAAGLTAAPESPWVRGFICGMCRGDGAHVSLAYGVWAGSEVPEGHAKYVVRKQQVEQPQQEQQVQGEAGAEAVAVPPQIGSNDSSSSSAQGAGTAAGTRAPVVHTEVLLPLHSEEVARLLREVFLTTYQLQQQPPPPAGATAATAQAAVAVVEAGAGAPTAAGKGGLAPSP